MRSREGFRFKSCPGCGRSCKYWKDCPAAKSECSWCLCKGHWAGVCQRKMAGKPHEEPLDGDSSRRKRESCGNSKDAVPDTGCTRTIFTASMVEEHSLDYVTSSAVEVTTANKRLMRCTGFGRAVIGLTEKSPAFNCNGLACSDANDVNIGWKDLANLGVVPSDFPNGVCEVSPREEARGKPSSRSSCKLKKKRRAEKRIKIGEMTHNFKERKGDEKTGERHKSPATSHRPKGGWKPGWNQHPKGCETLLLHEGGGVVV
jgi:hypothetical protein